MTLGRPGNKTAASGSMTTRSAPAGLPRPIRQLAVAGLSHDQPTLLITNRPGLPARQVIQSYARRMNIGQRLAQAVQSFGPDALAGPVPLNVDLDVVLSVLAHTVCAALRRRLPGYHARHHQGFTFVHPSGLPQPVTPGRNRGPPALPQASHPQRTPGRGGSTRTEPGLRRRPKPPSSDASHSAHANSCRTAEFSPY